MYFILQDGDTRYHTSLSDEQLTYIKEHPCEKIPYDDLYFLEGQIWVEK